MCDRNHDHGNGLLEQWVTPRESSRLRSKLVQLSPGAAMPAHTTGPGREEVITCIFGTLRVTVGNEVRTLTAGQATFIPENTLHAVHNREEDHALYCFVVSQPVPEAKTLAKVAALFSPDAPPAFCNYLPLELTREVLLVSGGPKSAHDEPEALAQES